MSYDAVSLYQTAYAKMLNYQRDLMEEKPKYIETGSIEYYKGRYDTICDCLEILKITHMLLELDGDNE